MKSLRDKVVVITGASAGVGRASARAFAAEGAHLGLIARGSEGLQAACDEARAAGVKAMALPLDVADAGAVEDAADRIEEGLGPIDVWVNNAMVSVFAPVMETAAKEFRRVTEVTYLGVVYGTLSALRRMKPRDRGTIVQVSSALAHRSIPLQAAYCAAKHAVNGFTESLRCELLHDDSSIHVTEVELPAVNTPQFSWSRAKLPRHPQPVPPIYQPEVAADAIVFAATAGRRRVEVGWPVLKSLGVEKLLPGAADRYLARRGYASQMTSNELAPDRPDNLFDPVPGDRGAHGIFDDQASARSVELWLAKHRGATMTGLGLLAAVGAWVGMKKPKLTSRRAGNHG